MTESSSATSCTVRAMGPATFSTPHPWSLGTSGTRPGDVRNPTTEQKLAGLRRDPPVSVPSASGVIPHASATAEPPLLPPHVFVRSHGFLVGPNTGLNV